MKRKIFIVLMAVTMAFSAIADEGMWLPIHINRLNNTDLKKMGLRLSSEEIYSINKSSLKDAIVNLGGGFCTGEIISAQGLLLTNHHCAYSLIQSHSTVENDILTNGFWAASYEEELPNPGVFVQFLVRMEDVTGQVLKGLKSGATEIERAALVEKNISEITAESKGSTNYDVVVKPFYEGNEYYLFVYENYHDVRLVGTPPESIGKFGGDTDNWMWPRHTGDFALLRVYSGPDGKPAQYSADNIPLKPRHYLPVSLDGVQENDFAMVMGYPGTTNRYMNSFGVKEAIESTNPARVKIRRMRLDIMKSHMDQDPAVRLAYASKYANVSNYWKYFIGQTLGLQRLDVYNKKVVLESTLSSWISDKKSRVKEYGDPVNEIGKAYENVNQFNLPFIYHLEGGMSIEFVRTGYRLTELLTKLKKDIGEDEKKEAVEPWKSTYSQFFKDYNETIDREVLEAVVKLYLEDLDNEYVPEVFLGLKTDSDDITAFATQVFANSILVNEEKMMAFLDNPSAEILENDQGYQLTSSVYDAYRDVSAKRGAALSELESGRRKFIAALREMNKNKDYYPDANSTMRVTYGKVLSYNARDAVHYHYLTTLKGVMEKEDAGNPEFIVEPGLKELFQQRDYGNYGSQGTLYVGFLTNNDITGGNSGSPVINGSGHLIGVAFDGNWEAMSGDIAFEPDLQRCISVDIRYVLFVIDKFAGAGHLINEMTVIKGGKPITMSK